MSTALDIITGALRRINSYAAGETLSAADSSDALSTLNDLLDSFSTSELYIYGSKESILDFTPNKYQYTIGSYLGGTFTGTITSGSATITGVTIPSALVAGCLLSDDTGAIPASTYVVSSGAGSVVTTNQATATPAGTSTVTFYIPGDFYKDASDGTPITRPLRITNAFTRLVTSNSSLDYPIALISQERYAEIGFKGIAAPWPIGLWYNPTSPLGTLYFYQNPSQAGELHLFTDTILTTFSSLNQTYSLPQGYSRFLKWALARELAPEYGAEWGPKHERAYGESRDAIKALNEIPAVVARFDDALINPNRNDAGWILHGGFGR